MNFLEVIENMKLELSRLLSQIQRIENSLNEIEEFLNENLDEKKINENKNQGFMI